MYVNKGASVYGHAVSIYPSVDFGNSINISILVDNGYQLAVASKINRLKGTSFTVLKNVLVTLVLTADR